ncbi:hypothetical protein ACF0H5_017125 [Mactra antiquata]
MIRKIAEFMLLVANCKQKGFIDCVKENVKMKEQCENRNMGNCKEGNSNNSDDTKGVLKENVKWQNKSNTNSSTKCDLHDSVYLFCLDCRNIVCGQCENIHSSHTMVKVSDASRATKLKLKAEIPALKNLIRFANLVIKDLNSYLEKLEALLAEIISDIIARSANLPEGGDILTTTLISDIQEVHNGETNRIKNKISEFDQFVSSAKTAVINCDNLANAIDDSYVIVKGNAELANASHIKGSLPMCLLERSIYILTPVPEPKGGETLPPEQMLGEFTVANVPWRIEVKRIASLRPEAVASSRFVTTMCSAGDEHAWVCWQWGPKVHMVDKEGNVKQTIDAGCKVDDICTNNGSLVLTSHEAKCIKIYETTSFELIKTIEIEKVPRGTYFASDNELVVCCVQNLHHRNGDVSAVAKVNTQTSEAKELPCGEHLIQPWRVAVNVNGDICVSDRNKGCVLILDSEGKVKTSYSGPETTTRHPFAPHAVCCDKFGQIFVVDYTNHTVHVLDPLGRFRGFLIMDTELEKRAIFMGTSSPFSITMDTAGDVWVGNKFGYLTILKYLI